MSKIADFAYKAKTTVKVIFNIPDYEKYVKHQREKHPGCPILTEKQFYMQTLKDRYESGKVNRCC